MVEPDDHFRSWDPNFSIVETEDDCPYFDFDSDLPLVFHAPALPSHQLHQMQYLEAMEDYHIRSSGYLQDVIDWTDRCKRRRTLYFPPENSHTIISTWSSGYSTQSEENTQIFQEELDANLSWFTQDSFSNTVSELLPSCNSEEDVAVSIEKEPVVSTTVEDGKWAPTEPRIPGEEKSMMEKMRKKPTMEVAFPFAVVKPNGVQGDVTLRDINRKILKRPTRPIQHPVGEFAKLPSEVGSGMSGKVVTALTRIRTQGKGTITIIRTRG